MAFLLSFSSSCRKSDVSTSYDNHEDPADVTHPSLFLGAQQRASLVLCSSLGKALFLLCLAGLFCNFSLVFLCQFLVDLGSDLLQLSRGLHEVEELGQGAAKLIE